MDEFNYLEDDDGDDDIDLNQRLDVRFVIAGILMLILSPIIGFNTENAFIKTICGLMFIASLFVMTKEEKQETLP